MEDLRKKAEAGNSNSMAHIGSYYRDGSEGLKQDNALALYWFRLAHAEGNTIGTARLGRLLTNETSLKSTTEGVMFLSIAAAKGSDHAAYDLGPALPTGTKNLPVNKAEAIRLLKKCSDGTCKTSSCLKVG